MKKIGLIIGQAPPERIYNYPFKGTRLYKWLGSVGLNEETVQELFEFEALVEKFPGKDTNGHKIPNLTDIQNYLPKLCNRINTGGFTVIIPIGKLSIQHIFNKKKIDLVDYVGKQFYSKPFGMVKNEILILPLPHPSGLNTWIFKENNKKLLENALSFIKLATET